MSQDVSTQQKEREPVSGSTPIQPWSAEVEADRLMDELFADLDVLLEGNSRLPTEPTKPEYISLKSIVIPQLPIPSPITQPQKLPEQQPEQSNSELSEYQPSETLEKEVAPTESSPASRSSRPLEKFILLVTFASVGVMLLLVLVTQKRLTWPWSPNPDVSPIVPKQQISASDAQFSNYMLRSLEVIDNKTKANKQATSTPGGTNTTNSPAIPTPSNRTLAPSQPQRVLERYYIPVPLPQSPGASPLPPSVTRSSLPVLPAPVAKPPAPAPAAKRSAPAPSPAARRAAPAPSPAAKRAAPAPSPAARRAAPAPSPAARRAAPSSPKVVASAPVSPLPVVPSSVAIPIAPVTQAPVSANKHTFVGFMQLGERPAALFQVGGVIQTIGIGEAIGDSGWTLVSVADQEAVIRRNGEVRSVYPQQTF